MSLDRRRNKIGTSIWARLNVCEEAINLLNQCIGSKNDNNAKTCSKNETLFLISHVSCYTELISSLEFKNVCQWQSVSIVTLMHLQHQQNCFMWNSFYRFNVSLRFFFVLFCVLCNKWNNSIFSIFYTFSFQRLHYVRTFNKAGYILEEKSI